MIDHQSIMSNVKHIVSPCPDHPPYSMARSTSKSLPDKALHVSDPVASTMVAEEGKEVINFGQTGTSRSKAFLVEAICWPITRDKARSSDSGPQDKLMSRVERYDLIRIWLITRHAQACKYLRIGPVYSTVAAARGGGGSRRRSRLKRSTSRRIVVSSSSVQLNQPIERHSDGRGRIEIGLLALRLLSRSTNEMCIRRRRSPCELV